MNNWPVGSALFAAWRLSADVACLLSVKKEKPEQSDVQAAAQPTRLPDFWRPSHQECGFPPQVFGSDGEDGTMTHHDGVRLAPAHGVHLRVPRRGLEQALGDFQLCPWPALPATGNACQHRP